MKKNKLLTEKILLLMLLALVLTTVVVSVEKVSLSPTITQPISTATHDVAVISVVPTPTTVHVKDTVEINVTVENLGSEIEDIDVYAFADINTTTIGDEITLGPNRVLGLASTDSNTTTFEWKPTVKGNYTISSNATILGDENLGDNLLTDGKVTVLQTIFYMEATSEDDEYDYTSGSDPNNTWDNEANAWDQTDDTYATRTSAATEANENNRIEGTVNTAPGSGPNITRVEIGVEHHCTNIAVITTVKLRPVFGGANLGDVQEIPSRISDTDKTRYVDVTSDTNAPSPWTWSDVQNLDVRVWGNWTNPTAAETLSIDQIRVKVSYLPIINGTYIDQEFTVKIMVRDGFEIHNWGAGMLFNQDFLECTDFFYGRFLKNVGSTIETSGTIYNDNGTITQYGEALLGNLNASGDGTLAYATFKVKALGVSNPHLYDAEAWKWKFIPIFLPINIIDMYTVFVDTTSHTVVTVSNSTGKTGAYHSGFYDHAFKPTLKEIILNVKGPYPGFCNVTVPKTLLNVSTLDEWKVIIDGIPVNRTVTYNGVHYSIYFMYSLGIHTIQITTRQLIPSTISMNFSSTTITLGENIIISGAIDPVRASVTVNIWWRPSGGTWATLANVTTDGNSGYTYTWTPDEAGVYEVKARWIGDLETLGDESNVKTLTVLKIPSTISITLSSTTITLQSNVTISGAIDPVRASVTVNIWWRPSGGVTWTKLGATTTDQDSKYSYTYKVETIGTGITEAGVYEVKASWDGDESTEGDESDVLTLTVLKIPSTISITLSSTTITLQSNVTISGAIDPWSPVKKVTILYKPSGGEWTSLANVTTDGNSSYTYTWTPDEAGVYEVKASWDGDESIEGDESDVLTLTVEKAPSGIPLEIVLGIVIAIAVIVAVVVIYFVKFRKPK